ncbi:MAG: hypothetical protein QF463_07235 [Vicinamibacterales bacterium]|nr:hypothetical protein [Vicinamibacterales bacterium]MDP6608842.1 hypothetical protein [Vicinamibacterales bacterium]|tara:strand:- start:1371 stop:1805 length:435 start_codon:yes stop_codon:yes gene_type:complete
MSSGKPTYQDADLMLRVYELRRESVTRAARSKINGEFWPESYDDVKAVTDFEHPLNEAWRQVGSYWEMVYGMAYHDIVHADYWVENNGEGLFFFAKVEPYLSEIRGAGSPTAFQHLEWAATHTDKGKQFFAMLQGYVKQRLETA